MGDEAKYQQSNSGRSANRLGKSGARSRGVDVAVALADQYPGIDGATMGWVQMGGELIEQGGMYHIVDADGFANFLFASKLSARAKDAVGRNKLIECQQKVKRSVIATGYRVVGGGSFPQADPVANTVAGANYVNPTKQDVVVDEVDEVDAPLPVPVKSGMPNGFMDDYFGGDD